MKTVRVPGDKSLTHRALMLAALGEGESVVRAPLTGEDCQSTASALRSLGVEIPPLTEEPVRITGRGLRGLVSPSAPLDVGNSGTTARLLLGILAGQPGMDAVLTGDASLRSRPMRRVTGPLTLMGARFQEMEGEDRLPIRVTGGDLKFLDYPSPVASAQVKSALLLAGLVAGVPVFVTEPRRSRDHTERLLNALGATVVSHPVPEGWRVELRDPPARLRPMDFTVPGDFSSAAFFVAAGLLGVAREGILLPGVGLNPTRTGLLRVLERMGAGSALTVNPSNLEEGGEPSGTIRAVPTPLNGVEVGEGEIPDLIDEVPILAVLAARARGETRITGAGELRVKESDRIAALVENLRAIGVRARELPDGLVVEGGGHPLSGEVRTFHDHRIAMAFGILGALPGNDIRLDHPEVADVSFPGFWETLGQVASARLPVVTLDGPAGSGKSTTARAVARELGFRHLDSGAIYRALTLALLEAGIPEEQWDEITSERLGQIPISVRPDGSGLSIYLGDRKLGDELRGPEVTARVSQAARIPAVRARLLDLQRQAGAHGGLVADGRDMGTVVFPNAELKVFLTADLRERARRRLIQEGTPHPSADQVEAEARRIQARDREDSSREASPLRRPEGAMEVDTTRLSFDEQVAAIVARVKELTNP